MSLYDDLGVPPDATPEEIKRAGREAAKRNHPDKGGDPDAFNRCQKALAVLRDPAKRARYDRDGVAESEPDNDPVLPLVMAAFERVLAEACREPRYTDVGSKMRAALLESAAEGEASNEGIKAAIAQLQEVAKRLGFNGEGASPFARLIERRIETNQANLAGNLEKIAHHRAAAAYVEEFLSYEVEERAKGVATSGSLDPFASPAMQEALRRMAFRLNPTT